MPCQPSPWEIATPKQTLALLRTIYSEREALQSARKQLRMSVGRLALADAVFWLAVIASLHATRLRS